MIAPIKRHMPIGRAVAGSSLLIVALIVVAPFRAFVQTGGGGRTSGRNGGRTGDVFSTNGRGNTTRTTGTQGANHGKGGNTTCQTTKNTPNYDPRTCTAGNICVLSTDPFRVFAEIDDFWKKQFAARGLPYKSPRLIVAVEYGDEVIVGALYNKAGTIFLNPMDLRGHTRTNGDQVLPLWLSHEFGHYVQEVLSLHQGYGYILEELQSDELAGVYLRYLHDKGCLVSTAGKDSDLAKIKKYFEISGDPPGMSPGDIHAHGKPEERWFYFRNGYMNAGNSLGRLMSTARPRRP